MIHLALILSLALFAPAPAEPPPPRDVRAIIRDARLLIARHGDAVWPGLSRAPQRILLVEAARETLFCAAPTPGFIAIGDDAVSGCAMQVRPRRYDVDSEATLDEDGVPLVVIGLPRATGRTGTDWLLTLLHEQFHQYQQVLPGFAAARDRADARLRGTASDAAWMLDHPFPYADPAVAAGFARLNDMAGEFLSATTPDAARAAATAYVAARGEVTGRLDARDRCYLEFQLGQEGVARWTELQFARVAGAQSSKLRRAARDRRLWLSVSLKSARAQGLGIWKRGAFYALGAAEAEMLDRFAPDWRQAYVVEPFALGPLLARTFDDAPTRGISPQSAC
ncbi:MULTISPECIES: hypothetical protein [unclassified Sphingomonas]|jgi:hypothetical protein|uniref:hypothetical protein n=1 Tax=unclassified Sphingomonas TaxID=196159 RepID=UPI00082DC353|nr:MULTISPECIES: hypothetical protein [unclassified Sphingomonas]